jgi:integrase
MGRRRNPENSGLPTRWILEHGMYFYRVPRGLEDRWGGKTKFPLGRDLAKAYQEFGRRCQHAVSVKSVGDLLDRYALEVVPTKAKTSQANNAAALQRLRGVFAEAPITALKPRHVYRYVDERIEIVDGKERNRVAAHREIEVLSHAYTKAVEWGLIDRHPFLGQVRLQGEKPRDRFIEDWEVVEMMSLDSKRKKGSVLMIQAFIRLKLLTGLRRGDLLRITMSDIKDDGIHVVPHKTLRTSTRTRIYAWVLDGKDTGRRAAVEACKAARPCLSEFLFCQRGGTGYVKENGKSEGFDSVWQRFVDRVVAETKVTERFTDSDVRAKAGSEQESLAAAQRLLGHTDPAITRKVYFRKPEIA